MGRCRDTKNNDDNSHNPHAHAYYSDFHNVPPFFLFFFSSFFFSFVVLVVSVALCGCL